MKTFIIVGFVTTLAIICALLAFVNLQKQGKNEEKFIEIIAEYRNAYNDRKSFFVKKGDGSSFSNEELHKKYPNVNAYSFNSYALLYYCFYDIDKNGDDELIISGMSMAPGGNRTRTILDIYLWDGSKPVKLSQYDSSRYVTYYDVYDNGVISLDVASDEGNSYVSGNWWEFKIQFFKIFENGYSFEKIGDYVQAFEKKVKGDSYYIDVNTSEKIDEELYEKSNPVVGANIISDNSFSWKAIKSK